MKIQTIKRNQIACHGKPRGATPGVASSENPEQEEVLEDNGGKEVKHSFPAAEAKANKNELKARLARGPKGEKEAAGARNPLVRS